MQGTFLSFNIVFSNYFYFSKKADKFVFFLNHCFHFVIYSSRLPIIKDFGFMGNKICHNIKNSFIENRDLLINTLVRKSSFSVEVFNWGVFNWVVTNRGCWLFILRKLRQFPQNSFFILFFSLASNGCWLVILRKLGHFLKKKSFSFLSSLVISKH